jgi:glycosyltransferase involved in cell wall biosynthesis
MRTALLVTHAYPPGLGVGFERMVKLERYLPDFGFRTCVLAAGTYGCLPTDTAKHVYRAFEPRQPFRSLLQRRRRCSSPATVPLEGHSHARSDSLLAGTPLAGIYQWLLEWLAIPDLFIGWLPAAILLGLRVIKEEQVDVLLSSSPGETAHLVAGCLSRLTGKPWVADFRDGWLFEALKPALRKDTWRRRLERRLERWTVAGAACVTTVTDPLTEYFRSTYALPTARCYTITNGYDPGDWQGVTPAARDSRFRLVHTGAFSLSAPNRDPRPFLQALKMMAPEVRSKLEVLLVGSLASAERADLAGMGLDDVVQVVGPVSRPESLAYQLSADLLLLFVGRDRSIATSKLYEYLYAKRPILALSAPDTAAARIVRQCAAGEVVAPDDPQAIAAALARLLSLWQQGQLRCQPVGIERYERREIARQMAEVLRQAISEGA